MLRKYLENIQLLYARGLLKAVIPWVKKGRNLAVKYELWTYGVHFINWERKLHQVMDKASLRSINEILADGRNFSLNIQEEFEMESMIEELEDLKAIARDFKQVEHRQVLDRIANHPSIKQKKAPKGFISRLCYLKIWSWIAFVKQQDAISAQKYYSSILELWKKHPHQVIMRPTQYAADLLNYVRFTIRTGKVGNVLHLLDSLDNIQFHYKYDRINTIRERYAVELMLAMNYPYTKGRIELMETIQKWLKKHSEMIDARWLVSFNYNFTLIYFTEGEYRKAGLVLKELRNQNALINRPDLHDFAQIMQIILQFEQKEYELVEYLLRAAHRYYQRQETMSQFERMFLEYLKKYTRHSHSDATTKLLKALHKQLCESSDPSTGPFPPGTYEVAFWLESKIKKISLPELMRKKMEGRPTVG
ncbi:MAG TPA: hypothetical protein ENJ82_17055 [Bacteroidetes bacterium]|nr:hypothetical protein [Bacteroidota bacterium]